MYKRAVIREKWIKTSVLYSNFSIILLTVYDRDQVIETKFRLDYIIDKKKSNNWQKNMSVFKVSYNIIYIDRNWICYPRKTS